MISYHAHAHAKHCPCRSLDLNRKIPTIYCHMCLTLQPNEHHLSDESARVGASMLFMALLSFILMQASQQEVRANIARAVAEGMYSVPP